MGILVKGPLRRAWNRNTARIGDEDANELCWNCHNSVVTEARHNLVEILLNEPVVEVDVDLHEPRFAVLDGDPDLSVIRRNELMRHAVERQILLRHEIHRPYSSRTSV
jgi:hypothetical protein